MLMMSAMMVMTHWMQIMWCAFASYLCKSTRSEGIIQFLSVRGIFPLYLAVAVITKLFSTGLI